MIKFGSNYASKIQHLYSNKPFSFAIIGSGPAGLYTAKHLFNDIENINIHVFEQDICPTGLIRYGMAPDHQRIKRVAEELLTIKQYEQCHYFGGVSIGKDISINELDQMYSGVFYAFGAQIDKPLNIKGEQLQNVYSARQIVNWYNSHPDYYDIDINFKNKNNIAIIGNGNVALDIARIFGLNQDELHKTDINEISIQKLKNNQINNIIILGRRGLVQSQFSLKELREMTKLSQFRFLLYKPDLLWSLNEESQTECKDLGINYGNVTRGNRRKLEFMKSFEIIEDEVTMNAILKQQNNNGKINIILRFLLTPLEIEKKDDKLNLKLQNNQLSGKPFNQIAIPLNQQTILECDMIIKSVGYQSHNIDNDLPWNHEQNIVDNSDGCIKKDHQKLKTGSYTCGWIKTGPKGVIDSTFASSQETIVNFKNHMDADLIRNVNDPYQQVVNLLRQKSINYIDFKVWDRINEYEIQQGQKQQKPRIKITRNKDFLQFL
ncbi:unnamed protein product [Paramecium pentaurelia]|uniref:NADPH:adrenodoxin oxidoreductase, mitochondrial n=1 Tax=Paramecium pentaurelia TaxID=43138 RepID=A0A8S1WWC5_9CILI|nr:unnamed protein product [Paramecium pentaurelia]